MIKRANICLKELFVLSLVKCLINKFWMKKIYTSRKKTLSSIKIINVIFVIDGNTLTREQVKKRLQKKTDESKPGSKSPPSICVSSTSSHSLGVVRVVLLDIE